jgi:hypothetical protein
LLPDIPPLQQKWDALTIQNPDHKDINTTQHIMKIFSISTLALVPFIFSVAKAEDTFTDVSDELGNWWCVVYAETCAGEIILDGIALRWFSNFIPWSISEF